jgi:hypothetical protein
MKMKISFSIMTTVIGLTWFSCSDGQLKCHRGETFQFIENASFEIDTNAFSVTIPELISGQSIAFRYENWNDCENVFDDEVFELMVFEIPSDSKSFMFNSSEELVQASTYFYRTGAWFEFLVPIIEGSISGIQTSSKEWNIEVDVTVRFDNPDQNVYREVQFSQSFKVD